jgi:hypothetical protein
MTTTSIPDTFIPAIEVLGKTLAQLSDSYQQVLTQPQSPELCREAGRTLRHLSERYAQVLVAGLACAEDEDFEDWEAEEETLADDE